MLGGPGGQRPSHSGTTAGSYTRFRGPSALHYNFARPHESLYGVSPAQAAGLSTRLWTVEDIVGLLEEGES